MRASIVFRACSVAVSLLQVNAEMRIDVLEQELTTTSEQLRVVEMEKNHMEQHWNDQVRVQCIMCALLGMHWRRPDMHTGIDVHL